MALTDVKRQRLVGKLTEVIGEEATETLMEQLPPIPWREFATKRDLEASEGRLRAEIVASESRQGARIDALAAQVSDLQRDVGELRGDLGEFKGEVRSEFAEIRGELSDFKGEVCGEFAEIRGELSELKGAQVELRGELHIVMARQTKHLVVTMIGFMLMVNVPLAIAVLAMN